MKTLSMMRAAMKLRPRLGYRCLTTVYSAVAVPMLATMRIASENAPHRTRVSSPGPVTQLPSSSGGGSYAFLYAVAGVCALGGAVAVAPIRSVR
jgi:hypothetical protein